MDIEQQQQQQHRRIKVEFGPLSADSTGSVQLEFGSTKVLCSVVGPRILNRGQVFSDVGSLECEVRFAPWCSRPEGAGTSSGSGAMTAEERQMSSQLYDALFPSVMLEKYQKSVISLHVMILQGCGGELAAAITAGSLALADAAVELRDIVTASTILTGEGGALLVDPEIPTTGSPLPLTSSSSRSLILAKMSKIGKISQVIQGGRSTAEGFTEMLATADRGCDRLRAEIDDFIKKKQVP